MMKKLMLGVIALSFALVSAPNADARGKTSCKTFTDPQSCHQHKKCKWSKKKNRCYSKKAKMRRKGQSSSHHSQSTY